MEVTCDEEEDHDAAGPGPDQEGPRVLRGRCRVMEPRRVTKAFVEVQVDGDRLMEALAELGVQVPDDVRTIRISTARGFVQFSEHDTLTVSWEDKS